MWLMRFRSKQTNADIGGEGERAVGGMKHKGVGAEILGKHQNKQTKDSRTRKWSVSRVTTPDRTGSSAEIVSVFVTTSGVDG